MAQNHAVQNASNVPMIYDKKTRLINAHLMEKTTILEMCLSEHLPTTQNILKRVFAQGLPQTSPSTFHGLIAFFLIPYERNDDNLAHFTCSPPSNIDTKLSDGCIKIYNNIDEYDSASIICGKYEISFKIFHLFRRFFFNDR
jgi:hypothetical protein